MKTKRLLLLVCAAGACVASAALGGDAEHKDQFQGFLVAANATDMHAPEFVFRVQGWSSDWGQRKLLELAPDGKAVVAGDVIGRFEFGAEEAKRYVDERIARAQSELNQDVIAGDQAVEALEMELKRKKIEAARAQLDLERAPALSRRHAEGLRILNRLAAFNVEAAEQSLASARDAHAAARAFKERNLAKAKEGLERYQFYLKRFQLIALHDGVVRHAFNARERRKMQKGDNVNAGMKVLSIAKDDVLAVRFFVPEAQASRITVGTKVAVAVQTRADEIQGTVEQVDFFPQEMGFLLENEGLPNGREKAIQMRASLVGAPAELAAGTEVKVRVRP
jgi:hypothetical protein